MTTYGHVTAHRRIQTLVKEVAEGNRAPRAQSTLDHGLLIPVVRSKKMPLLNIVIALILVGIGLYLINRYIPMAGSIKTILNAVVIVAVCVWVLQSTGLWGPISSYRVTR